MTSGSITGCLLAEIIVVSDTTIGRVLSVCTGVSSCVGWRQNAQNKSVISRHREIKLVLLGHKKPPTLQDPISRLTQNKRAESKSVNMFTPSLTKRLLFKIVRGASA